MPDFLIKEPDYVTLRWNAGEDGQVGVDATAEMNEDNDFEIQGEAVSDSDCVYDDDFGLTLKTSTGGDDDQCALWPATDADNRSLFMELNWGPENETEWECVIKTETLANADVYAVGLRLATDVTYGAGTDADQVLFTYLQGTDTTWTIDANISNVDVVAFDTGVVVTANTAYHFRIAFDKEQRAHCYINGQLVFVSENMTVGAIFRPTCLAEAGSANESMHLKVSQIVMKRKWGVN